MSDFLVTVCAARLRGLAHDAIETQHSGGAAGDLPHSSEDHEASGEFIHLLGDDQRKRS